MCNERFSDRLMVIPFSRMVTNLSASDMQAKSNEYNHFISSEEKPMELVISEFGDWIRRCSIGLESVKLSSCNIFFRPEFMELRAAMTVELAEKAMCIKDRTISVNYATGYAVRMYSCVLVKACKLSHQPRHKIQVLRKLYETFSTVWHDLGYSWEDCMEWMVTKHIPAMQIIHVEVN